MNSQLDKKDEKTESAVATRMWRTSSEREMSTGDRLINNIRTPAEFAAAASH